MPEKRTSTAPKMITTISTASPMLHRPALERAAAEPGSAPVRTPRPLVNRLHDDVVRILAIQDVRERLAAQGIEVAATTPQQFEAFLRDEIVRWGKAVKQSGAKPD